MIGTEGSLVTAMRVRYLEELSHAGLCIKTCTIKTF
jgi:hypothetical protein